MRLHIKLKPYIFHLAQEARTAKKILTVDEMITAFADHDKRHQHREDNETKTLRARSFYKSKNSNHCTHCDRTDHNKERCWELHPEQASDETQIKARWNASKEKTSGVKIVRSM